DGVERWIGIVDLATRKPRGSVAIDKLVAAVGKLAKRASGDVWTLGKGEIEGAPTVVLENRALKAINHLACDHQLTVDVEYDAMENGLPTKIEANALAELEDALTAAVPALVFHSRETSAGARSLFYFAPAAVEKKVAAWAKKQRRKLIYTFEADPDWTGLERYR
ncbi:MAG: DUF695 domain-containing protein, partial [Deltaproteobacteria bacterium]|nr:DUF695 domain-containing protein [Deltaproteobacteria bacterium]